MSATIGELSVFETLLGAKVVEGFSGGANHAAYVTSAVQRDMAEPKPHLLQLMHSPEMKMTSIFYIVEETRPHADARKVLEEVYPHLFEFINTDKVAGNSKIDLPARGVVDGQGRSWVSIEIELGAGKKFAGKVTVGVKVKLE